MRYDFLSSQQKCLHTTFNLIYPEEPDFAHCKDFFFFYGNRIFCLVGLLGEGGRGSVRVGWEKRVFWVFCCCCLGLVCLFLNTHATDRTQMAEAST